MRLVDQFNEIERRLPEGWAEVRIVLTVADEGRCERGAALLGPANPGRRGKRIDFVLTRGGPAIGSEAARRLLRRLDQERIRGELESASVREAPPDEAATRETIAEAWARALTTLPSDWSDLYGEVRLDSTDYLERAALLLAPVNPARAGSAALRFRCARRFGYGVSPEMAARCMERCDEAGITGEVEILWAVSDTHPVGTQGPVWLVGGRVV